MTAPSTPSHRAAVKPGVEYVILTKYETRIYSRDTDSSYGVPVAVYAESKQEAITEALRVGWRGNITDALVTVTCVEQEVVVKP